MPEPELIQRQRELLRAFRQATAERAQAEVDAEARYKAERDNADAALSAAGQAAAVQLAEAHKVLETAQSSLDKAGLDMESLLDDFTATPPIAHPGADPARELASHVAAATSALTSVQTGVYALQKWRVEAAKRRRARMIFAEVVAIAVFVVGVVAYQKLGYRAQANAESRATVVALQATAVTNLPAELRPLLDRFDIVLVHVPAGEFSMGSQEGEGDSDEYPQQTLYMDSFWIGLTEVTNAQYRPFVESGGYQQREFWTDAGWAWREENNVTQPACWGDAQWNQPNNPVVCVSWYEALAYTRWLARETALDVRLPTEAEWEKAARGTDGRAWPWGNYWPDGSELNYCDRSCNDKVSVDDGYKYTSPVGSFPAGASPYRALDMAGNVWEWTNSQYKEYPYRSDDGREDDEGSAPRVLRGGSWLEDSESARAAHREGAGPDGRGSDVGLRLVVAPVASLIGRTIEQDSTTIQALVTNEVGVTAVGQPTITLLHEQKDEVTTEVEVTAVPQPDESAPAPTLFPYAIVNVENLNVRNGPGTGYDHIAQVHKGEQLRVLARDPSCEWWWVTIEDGSTGWVSTQYLEFDMPKCSPMQTRVPDTPTPAPYKLIASSKQDFSDSQGANGWAYMWEGYGNRGSFYWRPMPRYDGRCWRTDSPEPDIRICTDGEVHPGWGSNIAYQWRSSIDGTLWIKTHFHKVDTRCGDGVEFGVYKGATLLQPFQKIGGGDNVGKDNSFEVETQQGDLLYFVIAIRGEPTCDMARVYIEVYVHNP